MKNVWSAFKFNISSRIDHQQPWDLGKKCDNNFIFTFATAKIR